MEWIRKLLIKLAFNFMTYYKSTFSTVYKIVFVFVFLILFSTTIAVLSSKDLVSVFIVLLVNLSTITLLFWIMIDTKYKISNGNLYCKSGPFRKTITISRIKKIYHHKGIIVPVTFKPALSDKGLIINYDYYDDIYISPMEESIFLKNLLAINPNIQITNPTNEL